MIDIKLIREDPDRFKKAAADKRIECDIDRLLDLDRRLAEARRQLQDITTEKNKVGKLIPKMAPDQRERAVAELAQHKSAEAKLEEAIRDVSPAFD